MLRVPLEPKVAQKIPELRKKGYSFNRIARELGIGASTARKYVDPRMPINKPKEPTYRFTKRQIEIAIEAAKKNARK
jgi:predicted transcriptional regulator